MSRREVPQNPPGTSGLPRHPALVALSREHHFVLRQALWLRRAAEAPAAGPALRAAEDYLQFYDRELLAHLSEEEEVVLPVAAYADPAGADRIRTEHRELQALTAALRAALAQGADPRAVARDLGPLLHDHVRFEERSFFMKVQAVLSPTALDDLQRALRGTERARQRMSPKQDRAG